MLHAHPQNPTFVGDRTKEYSLSASICFFKYPNYIFSIGLEIGPNLDRPFRLIIGELVSRYLSTSFNSRN